MSEVSHTDLVYRQVTAKRSVKGDSFSAGVIDIDFSIGGNMAFIPSKSYLRIGLKITNNTGGQPSHSDLLAPADDISSCLFSNCYFRMGGQDVSSLINYLPQASILKHRVEKSGAWLNTVGKSAYGVDADFQSRSNRISTYDSAPLSIGTTTLSHDISVLTSDATPFTNVVPGDVLMLIYSSPTGAVKQLKCKVTAIVTATTEVKVHLLDGATMPYVDVSTGVNDETTITAIHVITHKEPTDGHNTFYSMYQPPISIFDYEGMLGAADYRLQLNPNAHYQTSCVEKMLNAANGKIEVQSLEFYVATVRANVPASSVERLYLNELSLQSKKVSSGENNLDFTVPSSTKAIAVFLQSSSAGSNQRFTPTRFKSENDDDMQVQSLQLTYSNQTHPSTRWSSDYTYNTNYMTQRYHDSILASGQMFSPGGAESFNEYTKRGPYYLWKIDKASEDRSSHVQLSINIKDLPVDCNLFLTAFYSKVVEIQTDQGFVTNVNSLVV